MAEETVTNAHFMTRREMIKTRHGKFLFTERFNAVKLLKKNLLQTKY